MKYLFHCWRDADEQIKNATTIFILSDYDGTLTPIVDKPKLATLSKDMSHLLQRIVEDRRYKLAIISGRSAEDVKRLVGIEGVYYVGNHGFEVIGPDFY